MKTFLDEIINDFPPVETFYSLQELKNSLAKFIET